MDRRLLQLGDEIHCERCREWHPTFAKARADGGDSVYKKAMLWVHCRDGFYYVGSIGAPSRHPSRPATPRCVDGCCN